MRSKTCALGVLTLAAAVLWAPVAARQAPLRVFIRAGEKTHGPAGNDLHDYPTFLNEWTKLLTERGATVKGALQFPTADELAASDVLVIFKGDGGTCSPQERAALEPYLKRGGGVVVLHDGMCSDDAVWFSKIGGAAKQHGEKNFSAGLIKLHFEDTAHPITKGLKDFEIDDEAFFLLRKAPEMHVIATAPLPSNGEVTPQAWTYEKAIDGGKPYRSFVWMQGHKYANFKLPASQDFILRGIAWAGKRDATLLLKPKS
jgi:type 1 glutamine amidotransferase